MTFMNGNVKDTYLTYGGGAILTILDSSPSTLVLEDVTFDTCHSDDAAGGALASIVSVI